MYNNMNKGKKSMKKSFPLYGNYTQIVILET